MKEESSFYMHICCWRGKENKKEKEKGGLLGVKEEVSWSYCRLVVELWVETLTISDKASCWKKVCGGEEGVCSGHS